MAKTVSDTDERASELNDDELRQLADAITDELAGRRERRRHCEKQWKDINRQIAMEPETSHKVLANGQPDANKAWMPETELPLQAEALEMLTADARRLQFPQQGQHFNARAALTTEYLDRYEEQDSPIPNDRQNEGSILAQDNADQLVKAFVGHFHRQYNMRGAWDRIHAEAFKYSVGIARVVPVKMRMLTHDGKSENRQIPALIPRCTMNTYLDDSQHALMHEGVALGPNIIQVRSVKLADLIEQANAGGVKDGWLPERIRNLPDASTDEVELIELEGDVLTERDNESTLRRDVLVTVVCGKKDKGREVVRVRPRPGDFSTYIVCEYHPEGADSIYSGSPLMKGRGIAMAAAQLLNRVAESALLKNQPPIGYGRGAMFNADGGPIIFPGAQWQTDDALNVYDQIGGDPSALMQVYMGLLGQYQDVSGVNAPRLGAQTRSHTTAFAKDAEITRGTIRTVDYVNSVLHGPARNQLEAEYRMGRQLIGSRKLMVYVDDWNEFVEIGSKHLPDTVIFNAVGAGAPSEEEARAQRKLQALQMALQVDAAAVQLGRQPAINHASAVEQILREGGWNEVEAIVTGSGTADPGTPDGPQMGGIAGALPGLLSQGPQL